MASDRDWADGFLQQARADLEAAKQLALAAQLTPTRASVVAMLLQMAFEKFAKAALLRSGAMTYESVKSSHKGASHMVRAMKIQRGLMAPMGGPLVWTTAFEVVEALERAQPSLASGPQLEYPWDAGGGNIHWPGAHLPIAAKLANPKSKHLQFVLDFAAQLDGKFTAIFP